ncbi:hypothetical protein HDU85_003525 [Gaertneriomyces sp. JEL0708]|nr:hypothetical protein HDU85_003525 [Gaertneriomyces sp. JEL0708]
MSEAEKEQQQSATQESNDTTQDTTAEEPATQEPESSPANGTSAGDETKDDENSADTADDNVEESEDKESADDKPPKTPKTPKFAPRTPKTPKSAKRGDEEENVKSDYAVGDLVWAKLKGYPWWPAKVQDEAELPEEVKAQKRGTSVQFPVFFYGSRDYAWFTPVDLKPFEEHKDSLSTKNKTTLFVKALKEAEDPSIIEREIAEAEERKKKKSATPAKRRASVGEAGSSKKKSKKEESKSKTPKSASKTPKTPKKKTIEYSDDEPETPVKRSRKKRDADDENGMSDGEDKRKKNEDESDHDVALKRLMRIRSKLQPFIKAHDGKPGEAVDEKEYEEVSKKFLELENFDYTIALLTESKIAKVIKFMTRLEISDDKDKLVERSMALHAKLKKIGEEAGLHKGRKEEQEEYQEVVASERKDTETADEDQPKDADEGADNGAVKDDKTNGEDEMDTKENGKSDDGDKMEVDEQPTEAKEDDEKQE